jgi:signal transduction histidine kinase
MIGRSVFEFIHPADAPAVRQALAGADTEATRVFRYRFQDGSWHWLESAGRRFRTSLGTEMAAVISRDITERVRAEETRRQLEAQLREAQKMEAIGTLAGGIAHDFNNILTGLFGSLQLAQEELPERHPARPLLAASFRACVRARDLVAKILMFSRRREQQIELHPLAPIVREAVGLLRASLPATIEIREELAATERAVACDPVQIHQVLMNLGTNAAYAMRDRGGVLRISLDERPPEAPVLAAHPHLAGQPLARLTVADNGTGMDAATRARIFEPFFTTKPVGEGTGLGLAVVHGIVEKHRGAIAVDSAPGAGTAVHVWLPAREVAARGGSNSPFPVPRGRGERILFIDDEAAVCDVGARILERLGYVVSAFQRPAEALAALRREPAAFALVVSDLTMPELTGAEVAQEVRRLRPELPLLITTGYLRATELDRARTLGVRHFLEKPFTVENLAENVRRALDER